MAEITRRTGEDRLALAGEDLHAGEPIELIIGGAWVPARVEWEPAIGWYALIPQGGRGALCVLLRPGVRARRG